MRRCLTQVSRAVVLLLVGASPALAQARLAVQPAANRPADRHAGLRHVSECLQILDLDDSQRTAVRGILEAARPAIQSDARAAREARQKLRTDAAGSSADACIVGQDFLALRASLEALAETLRSVGEQVAGMLTPEQKAKLEGCLQAPATDASANAEDEAAP